MITSPPSPTCSDRNQNWRKLFESKIKLVSQSEIIYRNCVFLFHSTRVLYFQRPFFIFDELSAETNWLLWVFCRSRRRWGVGQWHILLPPTVTATDQEPDKTSTVSKASSRRRQKKRDGGVEILIVGVDLHLKALGWTRARPRTSISSAVASFPLIYFRHQTSQIKRFAREPQLLSIFMVNILRLLTPLLLGMLQTIPLSLFT